jgi:lipopolysaccharide transport system ATP-binding protein
MKTQVMPSDDIAISVRHLTKTYRLFAHPGDRIKQAATFGLRKYHKEFTALKDVSFDIKKGETVGIIGRNGSGKSTLLQLICGILKPTLGTMQVNGRVSALLELGAGFNPEFTGRENVYFQGALMGLTGRDMDARYDNIATFADIGEFIDQSVRTYSSGMFLRLAFAVAVHVNPDVLVVDEAIAVGDPGFRARCFRRIAELRSGGSTILLVSHDMEQITKLCERAILLDEGEQLSSGPSDAVVIQFQRLLNAGLDMRKTVRERIRSQIDGPAENTDIMPEMFDEESQEGGQAAVAYEPNGALIEHVRLLDTSGRSVVLLRNGHTYRCLFGVRFIADARHVRCAMLFKTLDGVRLGGAWTAPSIEAGMVQIARGETAVAEFDFKCALNSGSYLLSVAAFGSEAGVEYALHGLQSALRFRVEADAGHSSIGAVDFGCQSVIRLSGKVVA